MTLVINPATFSGNFDLFTCESWTLNNKSLEKRMQAYAQHGDAPGK